MNILGLAQHINNGKLASYLCSHLIMCALLIIELASVSLTEARDVPSHSTCFGLGMCNAHPDTDESGI